MAGKNDALYLIIIILAILTIPTLVSFTDHKEEMKNNGQLVLNNNSSRGEEYADFYGLKVRVFADKGEYLNTYRFFSVFDPITRTYILRINNTEKQKYIFDLDNLNISVYHEDGSVICNNTNLKKLYTVLIETKDGNRLLRKKIFEFKEGGFESDSEEINIFVYSRGTECDVLEKYDFDKYPVLTHYALDLSINNSLTLQRGFLTNSSMYRKYV